jgi:hypothetical protein
MSVSFFYLNVKVGTLLYIVVNYLTLSNLKSVYIQRQCKLIIIASTTYNNATYAS